MIFNEIEPYCCEWLKNLYPGAVVDGRSVRDVAGSDIARHERVHLFAGLGGWEYALSLAAWPDREPAWTGSCPCQPFSVAGRRQGTKDHRHLWPEFRRLIAECLPPTIFGEQVASGDGREWLAGVRADLEALGYAVGCADLCAACQGSPHIRQRLYWVAIAGSQGLEKWNVQKTWVERSSAERGRPDFWNNFDALPCADGKTRRVEPGTFPLAHGVPNRVGRLRAYGNAIVPQVAAAFIRAAMAAVASRGCQAV